MLAVSLKTQHASTTPHSQLGSWTFLPEKVMCVPHKNLCINADTAFFVAARAWKQPTRPPTDEWSNSFMHPSHGGGLHKRTGLPFMQQPGCVSPDNKAKEKELISEIHRLNDASWVTFWKYEITKMVNRSVIAGVTWDRGEMDMLPRGPQWGSLWRWKPSSLDFIDVSTLVEMLSCAGCDPWRKLGEGYMDT